MSKSRTFEGSTIEDALSAAARELGPDVEVIDANRERRGGVLGFFAKEHYVVTAKRPTPAREARTLTRAQQFRPGQPEFGELLLQMAKDVSDTYEGTNPVAEPAAESAPQLTRRARPQPPHRAELAQRAAGLIDLREGRRIPADPVHDETMGGIAGMERPSRLRRRLRNGTPAPTGTRAVTHEVTEPETIDLTDAAPCWSIDRLRGLGLGEGLLSLIAAAGPTNDLQWVYAAASAIERLMTAASAESATLLEGEGRVSVIELLQELERGKVPRVIVIDGKRLPATPNELALALRECLR